MARDLVPDGWPPEEAEEEDLLDELPSTHLDEEAYAAFLQGEFDAAGRPRGAPPVTVVIVLLMLAVLALAVVLLG